MTVSLSFYLTLTQKSAFDISNFAAILCMQYKEIGVVVFDISLGPRVFLFLIQLLFVFDRKFSCI